MDTRQDNLKRLSELTGLSIQVLEALSTVSLADQKEFVQRFEKDEDDAWKFLASKIKA